MSDNLGFSEPIEIAGAETAETSPAIRPRLRWTGLVAWAVIAILVAFWVWFQTRRSENREQHAEDSDTMPIVQLQGRWLIGLAQFPGSNRGIIYEGAQALNAGSVGQRLRFIVLAGDLAGPQEGLNRLDGLRRLCERQKVVLTADQRALIETLQSLYTEYAASKSSAPSVSPNEREFLRSRLGWFGALALAPADGGDQQARAIVLGSAFRAALVFVSLLVVGGLVAVAGLIGLVFVLAVGFRGRAGESGALAHGGVYAETFALWLALYGFLNLGLGRIGLPAGVPIYLALGFIDLSSLLVLLWPIIRGLTWRQVRKDLGLVGGRQGILEPVIGFGSYAMSLPFLFLGLLAVLGLMRLQTALATGGASEGEVGLGGPPGHPVVQLMTEGDWWLRAQVLFLAVVVAPIVEETMFRGVLYRQVRSATSRWGFWPSVLLSGLASSFIFAAIHPQGLVFVPALMGLALGFCIAREWRGSLVSGMVAHGLNNGLVMTLLIVGTS